MSEPDVIQQDSTSVTERIHLTPLSRSKPNFVTPDNEWKQELASIFRSVITTLGFAFLVGLPMNIQYQIRTFGPILIVIACGVLSAALLVVGIVYSRREAVKNTVAYTPSEWGTKERSHESSSKSPLPAYRLNASGLQKELEPLQFLEDRFFEPVIVQHAYSVRVRKRMWPPAIILCFLILLFYHHAYISLIFLATINLLPFLTARFVQWAYPVYYRLVPGRMDILRSSPWQDKVRLVESFDLRTSTITAEYENARLKVTTSDERTRTYPLNETYEPCRFVAAVFQAALSTHPAPPLPDDQLLG